MNKLLLVEDILNIKDGLYAIETLKDTELTIEGNTTLEYLDEHNNHLQINSKSNSNLIINELSILKKDSNITFNLEENSSLTLNLVVINKGNNKLTITVNMNKNNSTSKIIIRARNQEENSNLNIICNGEIAKNTKDNELLEDIKGLTLYEFDTIKISPNMIVNTNEVVANHLVTIGSFSKEELFYLKSQGMLEKTAKEMLTKSFTTSILSEYLKKIGGDKIA